MLWSLVNDLKIEKNYLQAFKLNRGGDVVNIEHTQEGPYNKSFIKIIKILRGWRYLIRFTWLEHNVAIR